MASFGADVPQLEPDTARIPGLRGGDAPGLVAPPGRGDVSHGQGAAHGRMSVVMGVERAQLSPRREATSTDERRRWRCKHSGWVCSPSWR